MIPRRNGSNQKVGYFLVYFVICKNKIFDWKKLWTLRNRNYETEGVCSIKNEDINRYFQRLLYNGPSGRRVVQALLRFTDTGRVIPPDSTVRPPNCNTCPQRPY